MEDIVILIPAYKPNKEIMLEFINKLIDKVCLSRSLQAIRAGNSFDEAQELKNIVIVNDGSGKEFDEFFLKLEDMGLTVLRHNVNKGKGRAIKTGFEYILKNYEGIIGTITADCDGQHTVEDIEKCVLKLKEHPKSLIVGCRDFSDKQVPFRSRFGNNLTRGVFRAFVGISISDTQSGLRAFGPALMKQFLTTVGERYEYETNMLIDCQTYDVDIKEVTIQTVYIDNNATSHFNPLIDSIRIYKLFGKYILAAISSFLMDILLFTIFLHIIPLDSKIMISTIIARILSSSYNFVVNSKVVFKKQSKTSILKYLILVVVQMFMSGACVTFLAKYIDINATVIKLIVDAVIFVVNFIVQREWVFKN